MQTVGVTVAWIRGCPHFLSIDSFKVVRRLTGASRFKVPLIILFLFNFNILMRVTSASVFSVSYWSNPMVTSSKSAGHTTTPKICFYVLHWWICSQTTIHGLFFLVLHQIKLMLLFYPVRLFSCSTAKWMILLLVTSIDHRVVLSALFTLNSILRTGVNICPFRHWYFPLADQSFLLIVLLIAFFKRRHSELDIAFPTQAPLPMGSWSSHFYFKFATSHMKNGASLVTYEKRSISL